MGGPPASAEWNPPAPRELPDLRSRLIDHVGSPAARAVTVGALRAGRGALSPRTGDAERDARILLGEEQARLEGAELFYVDTDMTRLAVAATATLPVHGLHPEDVPASPGFCVFADPIVTYDPDGGSGHGRPTTLVAVSWGDSAFTGIARSTGVWMTFWSWQDPDTVARHVHGHDGVPLARARERVRSAIGPLTWDNEVIVRYGDTGTLATYNTHSDEALEVADLADARGEDILGGTMHTGMIVRSAWLLMTQPGIADIRNAEFGRAERRRAQRDSREPPAVRVVRIRHPEDRPTSTADSGRQYSRRWTVRGHWRWQWYPSRRDHRPVWINPHIKGPADAPFGYHQTVHVLDQRGPRADE